MLFIVNGLTYVVIALAVARVWTGRQRSDVTEDPPALETEPEADTQQHIAVSAGASGGYRMLLRRGDILGFGFTTILGTMIMQGASSIYILRSIELGFGEDGLGMFYAVNAAGAIIGGLISGLGTHLTKSVLFMVAAMETFNAIGFGLFAVVPWPLLVLAILMLIGMTTEIAETPALTYFQHTLPEEVYGRFFSLFLTAVRVGGLVGVLLVPWLGQHIGAANALLALAITGAVVAITYGLLIRAWLSRA